MNELNKPVQTDNLRGVCIVVSLSLNFTTIQTPHKLRLTGALGKEEEIMSNRTWACIDCGKTYRRDQNIEGTVICSICRNECEYVHWKIHVPSPKKQKEWKKFWALYKREKGLIELWQKDQTIETITLDLLNMQLVPRRRDA